ncbi:hypothetical protein [Rhodococcus jostii]|uniref:hypothetical protein n=1 Tax=Rhodococcus jostii TaxID=132919 RepID=UPI00363C46BF
MTVTTSTVCEHFPTLTGRQAPHLQWREAGSSTHGEKASTLATRMGSRPMPWQDTALDAILAKNENGEWTHPDCCIICPRQNGKSLILSLRILYGLLVLGETIVFTAQRWTTAEDIYKRTYELLSKRPSLVARVKNTTRSQGRGVIEMKSGNKVVFTTRSQDAGRGLTKLDLVIFDEAYNLTEGEMTALGPAQLAADDPQTIYTSSAVNQEDQANGQVLASIRQRGMDREPEMYFAEFMAPDELDRLDEETWKYANPSYGVIQTAKKIRKLMRGMNTVKGRKNFDVDMLGRGDWPVEATGEVEVIIDPDVWGAMASTTTTLGKRVALAVDMSPDRKWISIAAAARTADGRTHVEVGYHAAPNSGAVKLLLSLVERWDPCALVMDRQSPAYSLHPDLVTAGIEPEVTSAAQIVQACGGFYDDAVAGLLAHTGDPLLTAALEGASKRELTGGGWAWDRKANMTISPLVAATLAHWALKVFDVQKPPPAAPAFEATSSGSDEFDVLSAAF